MDQSTKQNEIEQNLKTNSNQNDKIEYKNRLFKAATKNNILKYKGDNKRIATELPYNTYKPRILE